ncbi:MAG: histidine kinase dimerization/phospho-acceptor domain-containing protein, partial [Pirellulales bacterium]
MALVIVIAGCYWLSTVRMSSVTAETEFERMTTTALSLAVLLRDGVNSSQEEHVAQVVNEIISSKDQRFEIFDFQGNRLETTVSKGLLEDDAIDTLPNLKHLLDETKAGRIAKTSRYNVEKNSRLLVVAVPFGRVSALSGALCLSVDTRQTDHILADALKKLLIGFIAVGLFALFIGWLIALWVAKPARDLARAIKRVANGDGTELIPRPEIAELATIAEATSMLKEKLVERGLTLGRRDIEQEAVLDSMMEGVLAVDVRQRIVGLNQAAATLFNIDIDVALRKPLQSVVRNPAIRRFVLRAIDCRDPIEDDFDLVGPPKRTIRAHGTALRDPTGEGGAVIVLNDVTELERLEIVRQDFVANVSHELKTPIATIKGFVETLLDGAIDEPNDNKRFLSIVAKQADRLEAIIEDLLALSRIEQSEGSGVLPLEPTRITDLLAVACSDCMPRAMEQGITMNITCDASLIALVNGPL